MIACLPRGNYCIPLKPWKIRVAGSSERLASIYQTTQHYTPRYYNLQLRKVQFKPEYRDFS